MKSFLIWLGGTTAIFFLALHLFRTTEAAARHSRSSEKTEHTVPGHQGSPRTDHRAREASAGMATLRVPPAMLDLFTLQVFDPTSGEFLDEFKETLTLTAQEQLHLRSAFDTYFSAHTEVELAHATFLTTDQHPRSPQPQQERFHTIRIDPLGDKLKTERNTLRRELIDALGRSRGLLANSLIQHQLGNNGTGGELVSFVKYKNDKLYALNVVGLAEHRLRAGSHTGSAQYLAPEFSRLARYRHLAPLVPVDR